MAFKVVNNTVIDDLQNGLLENLSINGTQVLVSDGAGNVTLQNVTFGTNIIVAGITTDDLSEGSTNLYYTDSRVSDYLTANNYATESYVDVAVATAEINSNNYADQILVSANNYTDTEIAALTTTYVDATGDVMSGNLDMDGNAVINLSVPVNPQDAATKAYVDTAVSTGTGTLTTDDIPEGLLNLYYTDARAQAANATAISNAENSANTYTDAREAAITSAYETYADQAEADAIVSANAYTDFREIAITNAYQSYADTAEASAISTANTYTDAEISSLTSYVDTQDASILAQAQAYADATVSSGTGSLTTDDISEASNLYYTNARARSAISVTGSGSYNSSTGVINIEGNVTSVNSQTGDVVLSTTDISEGTNLYYTNTRANSAIDARVTKSFVDALGIQATSVALNSVALGTNTTGNYVATVTGTTGEITVTGSGSETASVTIGLPADVTIQNNLTVSGDLNVLGTTTTVDVANLSVTDNIIYLNNAGSATITNAVGNGSTVTYTADNSFSAGYTVDVTGVTPSAYNVTNATITSANATSFTINSTSTGTYTSGGTARGHSNTNVDLGWTGSYNDGTYAHAGLFRDATDGLFKVFDSYIPEPDDAIDIDTSHASFNLADMQVSKLVSDRLEVKDGSVGITMLPNSSSQQFINATGSLNIVSSTGSLYLESLNGSIELSSPSTVISGTLNSHTIPGGVGTFALTSDIPTAVSAFTNDSGYLTTETDPTVPAHVKSITTTEKSNWNTAFGWGDHSTEGYLTSFTETDPTVPAHVKSITTTEKSNWNTAFGWGDHSTQGYLTSYTDTNDIDYINGASFNTSTGVLTLIGVGNAGATVDLDGRYSTTDTTYLQATNTTLGLVKIGYAENGKNYPVELSSGQMFVNVPWTDTDTNTTSLPVENSAGTVQFTSTQATGIQFAGSGATSVAFDAANQRVTISSTDTNTTYGLATTSADGLMSSTDKTKIDGIESGATADQTAAEILTAIKTVDGAASGLDADLLDGNHASAFALATHTHSYLPLAGGTITGVIDSTGDASGYRFDGRSFSWNSAMQTPTTHVPHIMQDTYGGWDPVIGIKTTNGFWQYGAYSNDILHLGYMAGAFGSHTVNGFDQSFTFDPSGNFVASGDVTAYSDERLKTDIKTIDNALDKVNMLRGVSFNKDGKSSIGVIAQEVEAVLPEVVHTAPDDVGTKSVAYGNMVGLLIESVKELTKQNKKMAIEIAELKSRLNS